MNIIFILKNPLSHALSLLLSLAEAFHLADQQSLIASCSLVEKDGFKESRTPFWGQIHKNDIIYINVDLPPQFSSWSCQLESPIADLSSNIQYLLSLFGLGKPLSRTLLLSTQDLPFMSAL